MTIGSRIDPTSSWRYHTHTRHRDPEFGELKVGELILSETHTKFALGDSNLDRFPRQEA